MNREPDVSLTWKEQLSQLLPNKLLLIIDFGFFQLCRRRGVMHTAATLTLRKLQWGGEGERERERERERLMWGEGRLDSDGGRGKVKGCHRTEEVCVCVFMGGGGGRVSLAVCDICWESAPLLLPPRPFLRSPPPPPPPLRRLHPVPWSSARAH